MAGLRDTITMAHGSGGGESAALVREVFGRRFANETLDRLEDGAVLSAPGEASGGVAGGAPGRGIVVSTDSFVVTPLEFAGGDIGKLAVCGSVNDVLMMGAMPEYLTCGFILEEGLEIAVLDRIVESMALEAEAAGVLIVAGDTKVVERREVAETGQGLFISTSGIGFMRGCIADGAAPAPSASAARPGDAVIVSGDLGEHHACILSARLGVDNGIVSDCAALGDVVDALYGAGVRVNAMRDVTRGGLATVLNEIASASGAVIELEEDDIPVSAEVRAFCGVMGLDPLYMGNEGKMVAIVDGDHAEPALAAVRGTRHGGGARLIGRVRELAAGGGPALTMNTRVGGVRRVPVLRGEGLPRIC